MVRMLMHNNPFVRTGAAVGASLLVLLVIWTVSRVVLPQGMLRVGWGISLAKLSPAAISLRVFVFNLLLGACGIVLLNQWKDSKGLAAGYYVHLLRSGVLHGLLRGTNSFTFPYASQADAFRGFLMVGLWETVALSLISASTALLARYPMDSAGGLMGFAAFLHRPAAYLRNGEMILLLVGVLLLAFAAVAEGFNIVRSS